MMQLVLKPLPLLRPLLFLLLLLLPNHTHVVSSFASWLECYVDLDETEVVMNSHIRLPEEAPLGAGGGGGGGGVVRVEVKFAESDDTEWTTAGLHYPANQPSTVQARLNIPQELDYINANTDVQYVMETTVGAVFNPAAMCEGSRSHASSRQQQVLVLDITGEQDSVELWAGWATGHSVVSLTPRTVLHRAGNGATATATSTSTSTTADDVEL
jgi:hypothetical protein